MVKKISNKKRKLNFIRTKNNLLSGKIHGYNVFKVSDELFHNSNLLDLEIKHNVKSGWDSIKKKWKLKRDYIDKTITAGQVEDDFLKNLRTIKVKYFLVKKMEA